MPGRGYQQPYVPADDREERLQSAVAVARLVLDAPDLHVQHRVQVCKQALWFATECDGKLTPRLRTRAVMGFDGPRYWSELQHEHVVTLASLVDQMLAAPEDVERIVREAPACLVTKEEHQRLTQLDRTHAGWDRYRVAGIEVVDAYTGKMVELGDAQHMTKRRVRRPVAGLVPG